MKFWLETKHGMFLCSGFHHSQEEPKVVFHIERGSHVEEFLEVDGLDYCQRHELTVPDPGKPMLELLDKFCERMIDYLIDVITEHQSRTDLAFVIIGAEEARIDAMKFP